MQFNKEIVVDEVLRLFRFTKVDQPGSQKFFITTHDAEERPVSFSMVRNRLEEWVPTPGSARWIYTISPLLIDAIQEHEA